MASTFVAEANSIGAPIPLTFAWVATLTGVPIGKSTAGTGVVGGAQPA
ncbi:MAG: hypothetical protein HYR60_14565 [Acidobacteria bacterium]|nr:hypothetical protein [Acidobacteriota bacterium]